MLLVLCVLVSWNSFVHASNNNQVRTRIVRITGDVKAINQEDGSVRPLKVNDTLREMDKIVVASQSKATINLDGRILIYLDGDTVLGVDSLRYSTQSRKGSFDLSIVQGSMRLATNRRYNYRRQPLRLKAPHASVGVRGTRFWTEIVADYMSSGKSPKVKLEFICLKPTCVMTNEVNQRVMNKPNQYMSVSSRFERLPRPRLATAMQLKHVNSLTPAFPEDSDRGGDISDWSATGGSTVNNNGSGSGGSKSQSRTQEKAKQEKQEKQEKKESIIDSFDWKSIFIALGVLAMLVLLLVGAWFLDKKRR